VQSSLLFLALSYIFITFIFSSHSDTHSHALLESEDGGKRAAKKRRNLITSTLVIVLAVAVKVVRSAVAYRARRFSLTPLRHISSRLLLLFFNSPGI
jgi:hypothetical protein